MCDNARCPCCKDSPSYNKDFLVKMLEALQDGIWTYDREDVGLHCKLCGHCGGIGDISYSGWSPEMQF